jgi:hypothetical protein
VNILQQYKKAIAERGHTMYAVTTLYELEIGKEFEFGGATWQRVGDTVSLHSRHTYGPVYGYAQIIKIDAGGFKTARRMK